jgi:hypothetical protein
VQERWFVPLLWIQQLRDSVARPLQLRLMSCAARVIVFQPRGNMEVTVKIHKDKSISDQTFVLEETTFIECTLKDCDLFFSGGDTEIVNVKIDNCRIHFRGAAKNTIALMQTLRMIPGPIQLPPQAQSVPPKPN